MRGRRTSKIGAKGREVKKPEVIKARDGRFWAPVGAIEIEDGFNVRDKTEPGKELKASILEQGVRNPIHVRWKDEKEDSLYIIDGERRYRAAIAAKWKEVPIVSHGHIGDRDALIISLSANEGQLSLTPEERAKGFSRLLESGLNAAEIAAVMACSRRTVTETLNVLGKALPRVRKAAMNGDKLPIRVASRAASLPAKEQERLLPKLRGKTSEEGLEVVREAEARLNVVKRGRKPGSTKKPKARVSVEPMDKAAYFENLLKNAEESVVFWMKQKPNSMALKAQYALILVFKGEKELADILPKDNLQE